jgi:hypothetical protein
MNRKLASKLSGLEFQFLSILSSANVVQYSALMELFPVFKTLTTEQTLALCEKFAVLVRGCWVLKRYPLHPLLNPLTNPLSYLSLIVKWLVIIFETNYYENIYY